MKVKSKSPTVLPSVHLPSESSQLLSLRAPCRLAHVGALQIYDFLSDRITATCSSEIVLFDSFNDVHSSSIALLILKPGNT